MKIVKLFAFMAVCLLMSACGSDNASKVEERLKDGAQLTEADYGVMIDYCGQFAQEAQKLQDQIDNLPAESDGTFNLEERMASLSNKFPYTKDFFEKLVNSTEEEVGEKNIEKIKEYSSLTWFSAPAWAFSGDDKNVVGFIEDMPSSDSSGVISEGSGVEVSD